MATLALVAVVPGGFWGSALGWQALAYGAAALADSRFILPALFPPPDVPKPNVGDLKFQFAEEGSALSLLLGDEVPVTGGLIWASDLIVVTHRSDDGGSGGPPPGSGRQDLFVHCQIAIGFTPTDAGIVEVIKVWKDGDVFYEADPDIEIISNQITAANYDEVIDSGRVFSASNTTPIVIQTAYSFPVAIYDYVLITGCTGTTAPNGRWAIAGLSGQSAQVDTVTLIGSTGAPGYVANSGTIGALRPFLELQSPSGGPDLTALRVGVNATIAGFTAPATANNGVFKCTYVANTTSGGSIARFENPNAVAKAAGDVITITQNPDKFSAKDCTSVTFHDGSLSAIPDALVEGIEGVGNVFAYWRVPTMVVEKLRVTENGGRIGEFKFLVRQAVDSTRAGIISQIMEHAQFDSTEYDVSAVTGDFRGMSVEGSAIAQIQPLAIAHDVLAQQTGGLIRFFDRSAATVVEVVPDDMGAHEEGGEKPEALAVSDPPDSKLPSEVTVSFVDPGLDWQSGSVSQRRRKPVDQDEVTQISLPMVMLDTEARGLARRRLWVTCAQRLQHQIQLPPSYLSDVIEGNVLTFTLHGEDWRVMVKRSDFGVNGLLVVETEDDDTQLATLLSGPVEDPTGDSPPTVQLPGEMTAVLADLPPLASSFVGRVGFYYGAALLDPNELFTGGAGLYVSSDDTSYSLAEVIPSETVIGVASTVLSGVIGAAAAPTHFFDNASTVTVVLKEGSIASDTEANVLSGSNHAIIGREVVAFRTATLTATDTYVLSGLLRGLLNTQDEMTRHLPNEKFMLLSLVGLRFLEIGLVQLGNSRYYKPVVGGGSVAQATAIPFSVTGACVSHWAPVQPIIRKDTTSGTATNDDVAIRWHGRCLEPVQLFGPYPLSDTQESYEVEIWDAGFANLKRTLTSTVESVSYTAAEQDADFASATQTTYNIRIFQIHSLTGRSKPCEAAALAPRETFD